jgi:hypothetical protein
MSRRGKIFGRKAKALVTGLVVGAMFAAGVAAAAWLTSGSGSAYSKAGTEQALSTQNASADVTAPLFPGGTGDVALRVVNPNQAMTLTGVDFSSATVTGAGGIGSCSTTGVTISQSVVDTWLADGQPLPNGTTSFDIPDAASMSNAADSGCQGATFTITPVSLSATT